MIRPVDIQEKEFSRAVRGYKEDEVNAFLDEITLDLERLLNELRETIEKLEAEKAACCEAKATEDKAEEPKAE